MQTLRMKNKTNHDFNLIIAGDSRGSERPLSSLANDSYTDIPGRHGSILRSGSLQMNVITIHFVRFNDSEQDWLRARQNIAAWLYSKEEVKIYVDDEKDIYYKGKVSNHEMPEYYGRNVRFSIELTVQPFRYKEMKKTSDYVYPNREITVTNTGNFETGYKLTFDVDDYDHYFEVSINGKSLRYDGDISLNDKITVDIDTLELRHNGRLKVTELSGRFPILSTGDNQVSF